jgi:hypothetical protein
VVPKEQERNHGTVRDCFAREETPPNDSHGFPKLLHTAQKSDHTVRETSQIIKKGERVVQLEGPLKKKVRQAVI